jgi:Domain of unknown function (DUF4386)
VNETTRWISPRLEARLTGTIYLLSGWAFTYGYSKVRPSLIVPCDPAATAANILSHPTQYHAALATDLASAALFLIVTFLLYDLLRPVNPAVARLAASFSVTGCILQSALCFFNLAPLILLQNPGAGSALVPAQSQALAMASLTLGNEGMNVCMIFFGFFNLFTGYLIFRSTFLPRIVGALLSFAGACYLINYFTWFANPALGERLLRYLIWEGSAGELTLVFWLLAFGVNLRKWLQMTDARTAAVPIESSARGLG